MGIPSKNKGTKKYDLYPQEVKDLGTLSGSAVLDMSNNWIKFELGGNVTSITTINNLPTNKRATFTFNVRQSPSSLYTIDWLASGMFISSLDSTELQIFPELGSYTRYQATWNGVGYELLIDKSTADPVEYTNFILEIETTVASEVVTLPFTSAGAYACDINWGDDTITSITAYNDPGATNTYTIAGVYTIMVIGQATEFVVETGGFRLYPTNLVSWGSSLTRANFYGCTNLITISDKVNDLSGFTSFYRIVRGCTNLITIESSNWDTSNVTTFREGFYLCFNLLNLDTGGWDTSSLTTIRQAFSEVNSIKFLDVANWDVSNVTFMSNGFFRCYALETLDVSSWNPAKATEMVGLFSACYALKILDVSSWVFPLASNINSTFAGLRSVQSLDLSSWDVSGINTPTLAFSGSTGLLSLDLSNWDVTSFGSYDGMFRDMENCTNLNTTGWVTSSLNNLQNTFRDQTLLTDFDINHWDLNGCTTMQEMFRDNPNLVTIDVGNWDISTVITASNWATVSPIDTASYDTILIGWTGWSGGTNTKNVQINVPFGINLAKYTPGGDAEEAKTWLVETNGWNIIDAGPV